MERPEIIVFAGCAALAAWFLAHYLNQQDAADALPDATAQEGATDQPSIVDNIMSNTRNFLGLWRPPEKYATAIAAAEDRHGLPRDLLARLLYQESRYRADIIEGRARSSAGALGIAQFMPTTAADLGIDPLNPAQAIDGAARYLAALYRQFGNWTEALAAYNWGAGNVRRKGLAAAPTETRNYYAQILTDVNNANGSTFA